MHWYLYLYEGMLNMSDISIEVDSKAIKSKLIGSYDMILEEDKEAMRKSGGRGKPRKSEIKLLVRGLTIISFLDGVGEKIDDYRNELLKKYEKIEPDTVQKEMAWRKIYALKDSIEEIRVDCVVQVQLVIMEIEKSGELDKYLDRFPE